MVLTGEAGKVRWPDSRTKRGGLEVSKALSTQTAQRGRQDLPQVGIVVVVSRWEKSESTKRALAAVSDLSFGVDVSLGLLNNDQHRSCLPSLSCCPSHVPSRTIGEVCVLASSSVVRTGGKLRPSTPPEKSNDRCHRRAR